MLVLLTQAKSKTDYAKLPEHILKFVIIVEYFKITQRLLAEESHIARFNIPRVRKFPFHDRGMRE